MNAFATRGHTGEGADLHEQVGGGACPPPCGRTRPCRVAWRLACCMAFGVGAITTS